MNNKNKIWILAAIAIAIAAIAVFSLNRNDNIPDKNKMAKILADIYMIDAVVQAKGNLYGNKSNDKIVEAGYKTVLSKYGLTKENFDTIVTWYAAHPEEYSEIYFDVVGILSKKEAVFRNLLNQRDSINERKTALNDSLRTDYWNYAKSIRLPLTKKDTIPKKLIFEYDTDTITGGKITLGADYVFPRSNKAKDSCLMQLIVLYNDTISDTTSVRLLKTVSQQKAVIEYNVCDTLPAMKLKALLMKSNELNDVTATLSGIRLSYMPYEITDSIQFDEILLPPLFTY